LEIFIDLAHTMK